MAPPRKPRRLCRVCGTPVKRTHEVYCSRACYFSDAKPNTGSFTQGQPAHNRLPVGSEQTRFRPKRDDGPRVWVKTAEPNVWKLRSQLVWEQAHGPIPSGFLVHHISRDTLDDSITNLHLLTRAEHMNEHRPEFEEKRARNASLARWGHA